MYVSISVTIFLIKSYFKVFLGGGGGIRFYYTELQILMNLKLKLRNKKIRQPQQQVS